jgi:single-stranded-DNA-specific exonuclease
MRKLDCLISEARKAAVLIKNSRDSIRVVSHYDADGIAAAAIMSIALSREGRQFRLSVINQLSGSKIRELSGEGSLLTIFTDLGSGHLEGIQENLVPGARAVILDHHQIKGGIAPENAERVVHVNPLLAGISENLSGAGVAYLLAKELDPENADLSYLGVVGAVGDSQMGSIEESWGLSGPNREILKDARKSGMLTVSRGLRIWGRRTRPLHKALEYCTDPAIPGITGSESAAVQFLTELGIALKTEEKWRTLSDLSQDEQRTLASGIIKQRIASGHMRPHDIFGDVYELPSHPEDFRSVEEFATTLNACGKLGKHHTGISMCMADPGSFGEAARLLSGYRKNIGRAISWLNQNSHAIRTTERGTYMDAGSCISEHIISNIASIFNKSGFVPADRPVFAFADAEEGMVKVSGRCHDFLVESGVNMERLVSEAASRSGGEGGGHKGAAGATIPRGSREAFISCVEELLENLEAQRRAGRGADSLEGGQTNLNINASQLISSGETPDCYGTAESQGRCEGERSEAAREGREAAAGIRKAGAAEGGRFQKVEGQGLVRYFGPKDVQ